MSWFLVKGIGVSYRLVLQTLFLSWCSGEEIGVSYRLVPTSIVTVGWCLHDFIKEFFVVFSHLGFHVKSLCTMDCMVVYLSLSAIVGKITY
jgi:hypothetical protein